MTQKKQRRRPGHRLAIHAMFEPCPDLAAHSGYRMSAFSNTQVGTDARSTWSNAAKPAEIEVDAALLSRGP